MSDKETLLSFGFSEAKITRALKATKNSGLQPGELSSCNPRCSCDTQRAALDWLEKHADDADDAVDVEEDSKMDEDEDEEEKKLANSGEAKVRPALNCIERSRRHVAQSLKCLQCGKQFRNTALASYHGDK